jgi:hypothetical protein
MSTAASQTLPATDLLSIYKQAAKDREASARTSSSPKESVVATVVVAKEESDEEDSETSSYYEDDSSTEPPLDIAELVIRVNKENMSDSFRSLVPHIKWSKIHDVIAMDHASKIVELIHLVQQLRSKNNQAVRFIGHILSRPFFDSSRGPSQMSRKKATLVELTPISNTLGLIFESSTESTKLFDMPRLVCNFCAGAKGRPMTNILPVAGTVIAAVPHRDGSMPISRSAYDPSVHRTSHPMAVKGKEKSLQPIVFIDCPNQVYGGDVFVMKTEWNVVCNSHVPMFSALWQQVALCADNITDSDKGLRKDGSGEQVEEDSLEPVDDQFDGQVFYIEVHDSTVPSAEMKARKEAATKAVHFLINNSTDGEDLIWEALMDVAQKLV